LSGAKQSCDSHGDIPGFTTRDAGDLPDNYLFPFAGKIADE
jgi:hypothetical protein